MQQSLTDVTPMVMQAITVSINPVPGVTPPRQVQSALRCLQAWMVILRSNDLAPMIAMLLALLNPAGDCTIFVASSDALQEIASKSAFSDGSCDKTFTEPLLLWLDSVGSDIVESMLLTGEVTEVSHSLCKLLVALGDHSTSYIAAHISSVGVVGQNPPRTKGHLTQTFLRLLLAYTGLSGYYGVDEEESEMTLGFWYLFQEALWSTDFYFPECESDGDGNTPPPARKDAAHIVMAKTVYIELVQVLRRKVAFPPLKSGWSKDQIEKFQVYRRDVGDTLINAYYVLRDDMLRFYVNDISDRLATNQDWNEIEATLHCIMSIQEALDLEKASHLSRLFSPEILGRLPSEGYNRIRRTTLYLIGAYSSWFATQPTQLQTSPEPNMLLTVLNYVVAALPDASLSLQAATALRNLCDANRKALAPHIVAFGRLHDGLEQITDSEKSKVLQSIASVIQALPPVDGIPPIEAVVHPIIQKLGSALQLSSTLPEEARNLTILQLEVLSGVAKGLTRTADGILEIDDDHAAKIEAEKINIAREDPRALKLRDNIFSCIRSVVDLWSTDAGINHALSDLFKSITCLPGDVTLISLPAGPLLELVCIAAERQLTAAWLSLAAILIAQLNPPVFVLTLKARPSPEAETVVASALPMLLQCGLGLLGAAGAMELNPDIVQEFFACMDRVGQDFIGAFYAISPGLLDALMQCATTSLSLQERYSLVAACNFLSTLIHRSSVVDELSGPKSLLMAKHGRALMRAVLQGFAGVAPRSAVPNLIEMLGTLINRSSGVDGGSGIAGEWMREILFSPDFVPSKAGPEVKEKFIKAVAGSRSLKRIREAAQQFTLIARGLEGSSFGYASVSM